MVGTHKPSNDRLYDPTVAYAHNFRVEADDDGELRFEFVDDVDPASPLILRRYTRNDMHGVLKRGVEAICKARSGLSVSKMAYLRQPFFGLGKDNVPLKSGQGYEYGRLQEAFACINNALDPDSDDFVGTVRELNPGEKNLSKLFSQRNQLETKARKMTKAQKEWHLEFSLDFFVFLLELCSQGDEQE